MDFHAADPILVAASQQQRAAINHERPSADIMELCRIFLLNLYLKHLGRIRLFQMLQQEHERHQLATNRAVLALVLLFLATWLLQSDLYHWLLDCVQHYVASRPGGQQ
jgi:hypothetical protein